MEETPAAIDFLKCLEPDMALKILTCLDRSTDLLRAFAVSRHWQNIVVSNGLSKKLCTTKFPELACITHLVQLSYQDNSVDTLRDHWAYASILRAINSFNLSYCIEAPMSASSTNNYPEETIKYTMILQNRIIRQGNYWSSNGSYDPETPETLIYILMSSFCVVTEIMLHPFQGLFETDFRSHPSQFVRFRMGHPKSLKELNYDFIEAQECADDKFIWTYTSPIFPIMQENEYQLIRLPKPAVCIGGYMQIELWGRVKNISDGKYYLCYLHFQATGRKLTPAFSFKFEEGSNNKYLMYDAKEFKKMYSQSDDSFVHPIYKIA
ncbi:F-box protein At4g00755-like [Bidens hawaiensis]|uniref:F-box protein At4g00755-like n=1 Tax=Bidens hawaiensis TaxID=980011 RepID=UPI00404A3099